MLALFGSAWKKGLVPEDYDASRWNERLQSLKKGSDPGVFDVALTVCTMRYVSDLRIGRINPKHFQFGLVTEDKKYDLAQFLRDRLINAPDPAAVIEGVEPRFKA